MCLACFITANILTTVSNSKSFDKTYTISNLFNFVGDIYCVPKCLEQNVPMFVSLGLTFIIPIIWILNQC